MKKILFTAILAIGTTFFASAQNAKNEECFNLCNNDTFQIVQFNPQTKELMLVIKTGHAEETIKENTRVRFNWFQYQFDTTGTQLELNKFYQNANEDVAIGLQKTLKGIEAGVTIHAVANKVAAKYGKLYCEFKLSEQQVAYLKCKGLLPDEKVTPGNLALSK